MAPKLDFIIIERHNGFTLQRTLVFDQCIRLCTIGCMTILNVCIKGWYCEKYILAMKGWVSGYSVLTPSERFIDSMIYYLRL